MPAIVAHQGGPGPGPGPGPRLRLGLACKQAHGQAVAGSGGQWQAVAGRGGQYTAAATHRPVLLLQLLAPAEAHLPHVVIIVQEALQLLSQRLAAYGQPLVPRLHLAHALQVARAHLQVGRQGGKGCGGRSGTACREGRLADGQREEQAEHKQRGTLGKLQCTGCLLASSCQGRGRRPTPHLHSRSL